MNKLYLLWGCVGFVLGALFIFWVLYLKKVYEREKYKNIYRLVFMGLSYARADILTTEMCTKAMTALMVIGDALIGKKETMIVVKEETDFVETLMKEEVDNG